MANDDDVESVGGFGRGLGDEDDAGSGEEEDDDDEDGKDGPGKLDLGTAIDLRGLSLRESAAMAVTDEREKKEAGNNKEYHCTDGENKHGKPED